MGENARAPNAIWAPCITNIQVLREAYREGVKMNKENGLSRKEEGSCGNWALGITKNSKDRHRTIVLLSF